MPNGDLPESGVTDGLTRSDELIADHVIPLLRDIASELENVGGDTNVEVGDSLDVKSLQRESIQMDLSTVVEPGAVDEEVEVEIPFDGWVSGIMVGFPSGAQQGVGVKLEDSSTGESYFPWEGNSGGFAADSFFHEFDLSFRVEKGQTLSAMYTSNHEPSGEEMGDYDEASKYINCMITVVNANSCEGDVQ